MPPKRKMEKGKKWRQDQQNAAERKRNWTDLETETFCEISTTLETKALKKQANREVVAVVAVGHCGQCRPVCNCAHDFYILTVISINWLSKRLI